jgi:hypothetical protein
MQECIGGKGIGLLWGMQKVGLWVCMFGFEIDEIGWV